MSANPLFDALVDLKSSLGRLHDIRIDQKKGGMTSWPEFQATPHTPD